MTEADMTAQAPLLRVSDLAKSFKIARGKWLEVVSQVSFDVARGETFAVVGETGSGKSTLVRAILQLPRPSTGRVEFDGRVLTTLRGRQLAEARAGAQMVFQDPLSALDPRWTVSRAIEEPLLSTRLDARERQQRILEVLDQVGLDPQRFAHRLPTSLSGGQAQRVAIARAIATRPRLLICDEPVSALDVSVQAQILNLFQELQRDLQLAYVLVSHDLATVRHMSDRIAVLYLGRIVETGRTEDVFGAPAHPYTMALLNAAPGVCAEEGRGKVTLRGELPSPLSPPPGCRFQTRCPFAQELCRESAPLPRRVPPGQEVACHFPLTDDSLAGVMGGARDAGTR